jgi:DsbC/DsbD-like thiol-disulfide interchange protein
VATLRAFADKHGITFPLLSDAGSATIRAWGILNAEATGREAGIPHPGTFVLDAQGVIVSRSFERAYQERETAAAILLALQQSVAGTDGGNAVVGKYLVARPGQTDAIAAPGHKLTLTVDVTPGPGIRVYAPGQAGYRFVTLTLSASGFTAAPAGYPQPRPFFYAPLKETVQVFDRPFRITQPITIALTPELRRRATARETLTIEGRLEYQACDERVCYAPDVVPLRWSIELRPFVRK